MRGGIVKSCEYFTEERGMGEANVGPIVTPKQASDTRV